VLSLLCDHLIDLDFLGYAEDEKEDEKKTPESDKNDPPDLEAARLISSAQGQEVDSITGRDAFLHKTRPNDSAV